MSRQLNNRIDKLITKAGEQLRQRRLRSTRCKGTSIEQILLAVERALPPGGEELLDEIVSQVEEYSAQELRHTDQLRDVHEFTRWLEMLRDGFASLPVTIPLPVLEAWRDAYAEANANYRRYRDISGVREMFDRLHSPLCPVRCEACYMVLPMRPRREPWAACLVCGSTTFLDLFYGIVFNR